MGATAAEAKASAELTPDQIEASLEAVKLLIQAGAAVSLLKGHERTPVDEAVVSMGKMDVIDAINTAVTQVELDSVGVA